MFDETHKPTPKELYEQAIGLDEAGDKEKAAQLYEAAGYSYKAIQSYEALGNIDKAYEIAAKSDDSYSANRLASLHHISTHEFTDFPPARGRDFMEVMQEALESRLKRGATAEKLGFNGFSGMVVADVGTRDGRFIPLFKRLGAKEVYGIDPDREELEKAIEKGSLDKQHAIPAMVEDLPQELKGTFDVATVFNFSIPITERAKFIHSLSEVLSPTGQVVMTIAEREIANATLPLLQRSFSIKTTKLWEGNDDKPHLYLAIGSKHQLTSHKR